MPDGSSSTIKKGRKFDQVLEGAREVFTADGFEGASVDDIARAANVSKATLYSYFPDKRLLFLEVVKRECSRQACMAETEIDVKQPIAGVLTELAHMMVGMVVSNFGQGVFRICVAESERFPQLGQEFYESGPAMGRRKLCDLLELGISRGELAIDDIELAADQFQELCKADLFARMIFTGQRSFAPDRIERVVNGAVTTFMARYGA
ncbi:TetR/AcrR family transcriptional regulator [Pelagovum pacificum]|uniref:TetR/AcrR family transcriptional regulator n=1 Tax=Pelagovum pacificum TaxID=2588711 RepID=A0A5C5GH46_9RHOB|nr:TetR/AcrR family transcriptional regulator [Pelagovum pacificum]QQA42956.1 TetR/AcrR family transcriptional regulator [Pelagovum pacificum]TNY33900.1 TetR/AcrR family transcriptional regulator [Pelagovum pacificum]